MKTTRTNRRLTETQRDELKNAITRALDTHGAIKSVLVEYDLTNLSHALALIGVKSTDDLRFKEHCNPSKTLRKHKMVLRGNVLNIAIKRKKLILTDEEVECIRTDAIGWVRQNVARINDLIGGKP